MFLGVKVEKVSIFLVLSLQTHLLANDEVSVLPLLIFIFKLKCGAPFTQYAERDLKKTSNTLTETLIGLFLMA